MSAHAPTQDRVQGAPASLPTLDEDIRIVRQVARLITGGSADTIRAAMNRVADAAAQGGVRPDARPGLTRYQRRVLDYLSRFIASHGYSPSFEEIAEGCGYSSIGTVHEHVSSLQAKGYVRRDHNKSRSLEIVS